MRLNSDGCLPCLVPSALINPPLSRAPRYDAIVYPGLALWVAAVGVGRHNTASSSCFLVAQYISYIVRMNRSVLLICHSDWLTPQQTVSCGQTAYKLVVQLRGGGIISAHRSLRFAASAPPPPQVLLEEVPQHASAEEIKARDTASFTLV